METRPESIELRAFSKFEGTLRVPGSKSISNRALLLSALARGKTILRHILWSDDTHHMANALEALGVKIIRGNEETIVHGCEGEFPNKKAELFLGNSGTSMRSLAAALCLGRGTYTLTGEPRMYERPIGPLLEALRALGADIRCLKNEGFPPLEISARGLNGKEVSVRGNISSQYLTALLLTLPYASSCGTLFVEGELISKPYISLTLSMMRDFSLEVQNKNFEQFEVPKGIYLSPGEYEIEGDASSASYALAGAAIAKGKVRIEGVGKNSRQGDAHFVDVLEQMGAKIRRGDSWIECEGGDLLSVDVDLNAMPDAAMTLAPVALFAKGVTTIRGIGSWKVKETDRLAALSTELKKTGAHVETTDDSIAITPPETLRSATFTTYNDHRMAMCMSLVSLGGVPVKILDPACVNKTYPNYFEDFFRLAK